VDTKTHSKIAGRKTAADLRWLDEKASTSFAPK
jgi:hypothetical protein